MSTRYRYAIIGTGRPLRSEGATGFGMAHPHYHGFVASGKTDLIAIANIRDDNARLFVEKYDSKATIYHDYHEMLAQEKPDIVSICTWPHLHAEMAVAACEAGVRAVHCEKPMATTWGDARRMKAAADANGTLLTFNHQRRFLEPFRKAKQLLTEGVIGELQRLEAECGDLSDWGTHWLDMLFFFNDETPAEWVIGQIDSREERRIFGAYTEEQGICHFKWINGVRGLLITGNDAKIGAAIRLVGTEGAIELTWESKPLRVRGKGDAEWRTIPTEESLHGDIAIDRACADLVRALDEPGYKPLLSVDNAIHHTEVIFATYESSRWRGRIDLPLQTDDSALIAMVEDGSLGPNRL
ncbi:MAG TPA: Gfo/Idh/MocA family oxidoreductase [Chthonomonadaceae bacterium]|nr:Gfo/Idh/MocA family oxidoreductase [Chthonomonadaceae bacterium]